MPAMQNPRIVRQVLRDAGCIVSFWTPRLRQDLLAHADRDPTGLDPLVVAAVHAVGSGRSPTYKEAAGPG
jgi:hypothetical protein